MAKEKVNIQLEKHNGYWIELQDNRIFVVPVLELEADSFEDIKKLIDKQKSVKKHADKIKLEIPVLDEEGQSRTITGINVRNHHITVTADENGNRSTSWGSKFYPDHQLIRELLEDVIEADRVSSRLHGCLEDFIIDSRRSNHLSVEDAQVELQKEVAELVKKLNKSNKLRLFERWDNEHKDEKPRRHIRL